MAEHNPNPPPSLSDDDGKTPNIFESAKDGIESVIHAGNIHQFHKETHGNRDDIDESTPLDDVKAPNVFERAKEEIEALVETIHHEEESQSDDEKRDQSAKKDSKRAKLGSLIGRAKKEMKAVVHTSKEQFFKGNRSKRDDSDEGDKSLNVFERAKDKIETFVDKVYDDKESHSHRDKSDHDTDVGSKDHDKPENGVKTPNLIEKAEGGIKAAIQSGKAHFHKEAHGSSDSDDEDVKAPHVFERAKEEIEALVGTIRQKKESHTPESDGERDHSTKAESKDDKPGIGDKASVLIDRAKEEIKSMFQHDKSPHHHKETHGRSDDIDENTAVNEVKAPNVFERAKEEIDAIVGKMHPEKDSDDSVPPPKDEGTFRHCLGLSFEKLCHPWGTNRD